MAAELERRWNERLAQVSQRQAEIEALEAQAGPSLTPRQRDELMALGAELPRVWSHPAAGNEVRKRILRCVIREIVARVAEARIELVIHWQGGDHTELSVVKNRVGPVSYTHLDVYKRQQQNCLGRRFDQVAVDGHQFARVLA